MLIKLFLLINLLLHKKFLFSKHLFSFFFYNFHSFFLLQFFLFFFSHFPSIIYNLTIYNDFLLSIETLSTALGLGSSCAHLIVKISPLSKLYFSIASLANSAMHLCLYLTKINPFIYIIFISSTSPYL